MAIHLWNTREVVNDLAGGAIGDKEAASYYLALTMLGYISNWSAIWNGANRSWLFVFEMIATALIVVLGLSECFKVNGGKNGNDFLLRVVCLSVPIGVKLAVLAFLIAEIASYWFRNVGREGLFRDIGFVYDLYGFVFMTGFAYVFYWRLVSQLRILAARTDLRTQGDAAQSPRA